jgi:tRNA synthetases class II core domain (F)
MATHCSLENLLTPLSPGAAITRFMVAWCMWSSADVSCTGVICDRGVTLGDLIGTLHLFFQQLGLPQLRFKPAYNPYTEPSMEIFR